MCQEINIMRITISAIAKIKAGPEAQMIEDYNKRNPWDVAIKQDEVRKNLTGEALQLAEAELIEKHIPEGATVIALDERGKEFTSRSFAGKLESYQDTGVRDVCFIIGGADGLHARLKSRSDLMIHFGRMTWPHKLVRVMLSEQLYRAAMILKGHPYHRD